MEILRRTPEVEVDTTRAREQLVRRAVSDLIRTQRKRHASFLTQERLADLSDISFEHLNRIENHKATASVEVLDRIARALGFQRLSEFLAQDERRIL
jgi:ribosome-binding protein aMBF1 (putative translation factor)